MSEEGGALLNEQTPDSSREQLASEADKECSLGRADPRDELTGDMGSVEEGIAAGVQTL